MKNIKYISLFVWCLLVFPACDESEYEYDNLFPEEYKKILYINNEGMHDMVLYNTGEDFEYSFSVYKAGSEPTSTASVKVEVMSQEEIDRRYSEVTGINYQVITGETYEILTPQLDFGADDKYKFIDLKLKTELIDDLTENNPDVAWVLPIKIASADSINSNKDHAIFNFTAVLTPAVGFGISGVDLKEIAINRVSDQKYLIPLQLDVANMWDIECELEVDESYVATYNAANGTNYQLLPASLYQFNDKPVFTTEDESLELELKVEATKLDLARYMLPIRVKSVSMMEISETNGLYVLAIDMMAPVVDKANWSVTADSQEAGGEGAVNGYVSALIDNDLNTFWHTRWNGAEDPMPHEFTVDMKKAYRVGQIGLAQRSGGNRYTKDFEIYLSTDNQTWTAAGNHELADRDGYQIFHVTAQQARYVKVVITSSRKEPFASLAEINVYGL